jgi:hypothetical protein
VSIRAATAILLVLAALGLLVAIERALEPASQTRHSARGHTPAVGQAASFPAATFTHVTTAPSQPPPRRHTHAEIDRQDSYNHTRAFKAYVARQRQQRPAYQHLPYRGEEARIEIADITSDGRLVLKVVPLGMNVNPRVAYRRFLARYRDPGSAYLPEYGRYEP